MLFVEYGRRKSTDGVEILKRFVQKNEFNALLKSFRLAEQFDLIHGIYLKYTGLRLSTKI